MSVKTLETHWTDIVEKVVKPLWASCFESIYRSNRLDYDDFESMAGYELTKAFSSYDENKSNVLTFATNVIKNKARTEIRNATRDRRRAFSESGSLNVPINENGSELILTIAAPEQTENSLLSERRVGAFVKNCSNKQLRILILQLLGFEEEEIVGMLEVEKKQYQSEIEELKNIRNSKYLTQRGGF